MKRLLLLTAIFLSACGPSNQAKEEIAIITCNIMGESRNMDGAVRIKEINTSTLVEVERYYSKTTLVYYG